MNRIILIGCGKQKQATSCEAKDLYIGKLFKARRAYAERSGLPWFIVSALHHVIDPEKVIRPYDKTMPTQKHAVARWEENFNSAIVSLCCDRVVVFGWQFLYPVIFEIHAGADYVRPIRHLMRYQSQVTIEHPVSGMGIGEQIAFYNRQ
jgi:hypothetical protein